MIVFQHAKAFNCVYVCLKVWPLFSPLTAWLESKYRDNKGKLRSQNKDAQTARRGEDSMRQETKLRERGGRMEERVARAQTATQIPGRNEMRRNRTDQEGRRAKSRVPAQYVREKQSLSVCLWSLNILYLGVKKNCYHSNSLFRIKQVPKTGKNSL